MMSKFEEGLSIVELLKRFNSLPPDLECFKQIGYLTEEHYSEYKNAYELFVEMNEGDFTKKEKGKSLEQLVQIMFQATGGFYEIYANVRNGSNEIDIILKLSDKGIIVRNIIDSKYQKFIGECKNYGGKVSVTYVGKFYSLMQTTHCNLGIGFSYHGISGESWGGGKGLTKKLFLLSEGGVKNTYILDFCKTDFQSILNGQSIFAILDRKCFELETGVDCMSYVTTHPNEEKIKPYVE